MTYDNLVPDCGLRLAEHQVAQIVKNKLQSMYPGRAVSSPLMSWSNEAAHGVVHYTWRTALRTGLDSKFIEGTVGIGVEAKDGGSGGVQIDVFANVQIMGQVTDPSV